MGIHFKNIISLILYPLSSWRGADNGNLVQSLVYP